MQYSKERKEAVLKKMMPPHNRSVVALAREEGISEDPIGFAGGDTNLMAYVGNNPVTGVDPWGLSWQSNLWSATKGAAVGAAGAAGAVGVGVVAVAAAYVGVPVVAITIGLGTIGAVGATVTGYNIGIGMQKGDWDSVAYSVGSLAGGLAVGAGSGRLVAEGVNGVPSGKFVWNDSFQNYQSGLGSVWTWPGTGPNVGSAAATVGVGGSSASVMRRSTGGCP